MENVYKFNGLPFYTEDDLILKDYLVKKIALGVKKILKEQNNEWDFIQIESPCLIPREYVSSNYTNEDLYVQETKNHSELVLKPETTPATYEFMKQHIKNRTKILPCSFWQVSKSFRREQDQATKHCRFKEFYQLEFQCLYYSDTMNDYQSNIIMNLASLLSDVVGLDTRVVVSDRLPDYSIRTLDVEVWNGDKWMEICSCSVRKDFTEKILVKSKEISCLVLEIAIGIDRLIYNISRRNEVNNITVTKEFQ